MPGIRVSVYAIPVWVVFMWGCYLLKNKRALQASAAASTISTSPPRGPEA